MLFCPAGRYRLFAFWSFRSPSSRPVRRICRECFRSPTRRSALPVGQHIDPGLGRTTIGIPQLLPCQHNLILNSSPSTFAIKSPSTPQRSRHPLLVLRSAHTMRQAVCNLLSTQFISVAVYCTSYQGHCSIDSRGHQYYSSCLLLSGNLSRVHRNCSLAAPRIHIEETSSMCLNPAMATLNCLTNPS